MQNRVTGTTDESAGFVRNLDRIMQRIRSGELTAPSVDPMKLLKILNLNLEENAGDHKGAVQQRALCGIFKKMLMGTLKNE